MKNDTTSHQIAREKKNKIMGVGLFLLFRVYQIPSDPEIILSSLIKNGTYHLFFIYFLAFVVVHPCFLLTSAHQSSTMDRVNFPTHCFRSSVLCSKFSSGSVVSPWAVQSLRLQWGCPRGPGVPEKESFYPNFNEAALFLSALCIEILNNISFEKQKGKLLKRFENYWPAGEKPHSILQQRNSILCHTIT